MTQTRITVESGAKFSLGRFLEQKIKQTRKDRQSKFLISLNSFKKIIRKLLFKLLDLQRVPCDSKNFVRIRFGVLKKNS